MGTILIRLRDVPSVTEVLKDGSVSMIFLWKNHCGHSDQPGRLTAADCNVE